MKWFLILLFLCVGSLTAYWQFRVGNTIRAVFVGVVSTIAIGLFTSFVYDEIKGEVTDASVPNSAVSSPLTESSREVTSEHVGTSSEEETEERTSNISYKKPETNVPFLSSNEKSDTSIKAFEDITGRESVKGVIHEDDQEDKYKYTASVTGTYHFNTDRSSGGDVRIRVSGENGQSIDFGINELSIDLYEGKSYILSVEERNGYCDYMVSIGVPIAIGNITGATSVSGKITYKDQKDKYFYTASVSGIYRFDTHLSSGGEVRVRISGENGESIEYGTNALTISLESGKTYILSIEYRNGSCDYAVAIGVPVKKEDITGNSSISGSIDYKDQKNQYIYTAPVDGAYRFDSNLSSGGEIRVRISGENENSINYGTNNLTVDLEKGKTYILSIEYRNGPCKYMINIGIPIEISDITETDYVWGSIAYKDQKDKYTYTAPLSGTYFFNIDLGEGESARIRISGENGNSINYGINSLKIDLEEGKTYILSVEYNNTLCEEYMVNIETP